jgi:hypothetical protein
MGKKQIAVFINEKDCFVSLQDLHLKHYNNSISADI